jgi:hypothetical protein
VSGLRQDVIDALFYASDERINFETEPSLVELADAVLRVLAEHGGVANLREQISLMVWRSANKRAERAEADLAETKQRLEWTTRDMRMLEADLAAARQQLDQVRAYATDWDNQPVRADLLTILDAPARPAGHDEAGQ